MPGSHVHQEADNAGRLVSVNVAVPRIIETSLGPVASGICKEPVAGPVMVRRLNVDGDRQADLRVHGGPEKALYCYPHEHYAWWAEQLGRDAGAPGWFGENLTTEGLLETVVRIGDVYRVGAARLEVTQPRSPCFKLAAKMGLRGFERRFMRSGRSGWYARVLEEGLVAAGDAIARESPGEGPTVHEAQRAWRE